MVLLPNQRYEESQRELKELASHIAVKVDSRSVDKVIRETFEVLAAHPAYGPILLDNRKSAGIQLHYEMADRVAQIVGTVVRTDAVSMVYRSLMNERYAQNWKEDQATGMPSPPTAQIQSAGEPQAHESLSLGIPQKGKIYDKGRSVGNAKPMPAQSAPAEEEVRIYKRNTEYDFDPGGLAIGTFRNDIEGVVKKKKDK